MSSSTTGKVFTEWQLVLKSALLTSRLFKSKNFSSGKFKFEEICVCELLGQELEIQV